MTSRTFPAIKVLCNRPELTSSARVVIELLQFCWKGLASLPLFFVTGANRSNEVSTAYAGFDRNSFQSYLPRRRYVGSAWIGVEDEGSAQEGKSRGHETTSAS